MNETRKKNFSILRTFFEDAGKPGIHVQGDIIITNAKRSVLLAMKEIRYLHKCTNNLESPRNEGYFFWRPGLLHTLRSILFSSIQFTYTVYYVHMAFGFLYLR